MAQFHRAEKFACVKNIDVGLSANSPSNLMLPVILNLFQDPFFNLPGGAEKAHVVQYAHFQQQRCLRNDGS